MDMETVHQTSVSVPGSPITVEESTRLVTSNLTFTFPLTASRPNRFPVRSILGVVR